MSFSKILVANRAEIAVRVIRTARALGYRTVAVFSEADAGAPHTQHADQAVLIGPSPATESYLNIERILQAARRTGADAVHPGYGFLSENATFAQACAEVGITFIGPPAEAIVAMGDKARAKARMQQAGVPVVPGYLGDSQDDAQLAAEAERVGYPLLVKAVSGGGGRGMRLVETPDVLAEALQSARREAESAFSDGTLMLERFVPGARHIEIQIFADSYGDAIHLAERDCTAQRRRQKVIEEAPSPVVDEPLRQKMGADAVRAAKAIGYVGAGTVELIVAADRSYYFLEMNTRLQVEHPVTEMITGLDLVDWQLRVAAGEPLPLAQDQIQLEGHAVEARLYAEDPYAGFRPQTGTIRWFRPGALADRTAVRIDAGVAEGDTISPFYDAMVAKVIAHGHNRAAAIRRLCAALADMPLVGVRTNQHFLIDLLTSEAFAGSELDTGSLDRWQQQGHPMLAPRQPTARCWALAAALFAQAERDGFRPSSPALVLALEHGAADAGRPGAEPVATRTLTVERAPDSGLRISASNGDEDEQDTLELTVLSYVDGLLRYRVGDVTERAYALRCADGVYLDAGHGLFAFREASPYPAAAGADDPSRLLAPVAGTLLQLCVQPGAEVKAGDVVAVIEAMKMETRVMAARDGRVEIVHVEQGAQIEQGALIAELGERDAAAEAGGSEPDHGEKNG